MSPFANRSTHAEHRRVGTGFASPRYHGFASSGRGNGSARRPDCAETPRGGRRILFVIDLRGRKLQRNRSIDGVRQNRGRFAP
jgi:hypothetical protein